MNPKGNPNIKDIGHETRFSSGSPAAVEAARKGALAGHENERRRKSRQELSHMIGSLPASVLKNRKKVTEVVEAVTEAGIATEEQTWDAIEVARMHMNALEGDVASFRTLGDLDGDFKQNLDVGLQVSTPEDEEKALANIFGECQTNE